MSNVSDIRAQGLRGKLTTDYFEFQCSKCESWIRNLVFYKVDTVGVQLLARCDKCEFSYIFKLQTRPMLGPIQLTKKLGRISYKAYDKRSLNKRLKELGHPHISKQR